MNAQAGHCDRGSNAAPKAQIRQQLVAKGLSKQFGGLQAVAELDLDVREGEILGVIGPNGAGKSTTFNMIAGALAPTHGSLVFDGKELTGLPAHAMASRGIMRAFQHNKPFASMTVRRADELVAFVGLGEWRDADVDTLSFGQGRLLEIARALASELRMILFDEPAAGLTPAECERLSDIIRQIAQRGIAVLLIEHDMRFLMALADRVAVLNFGRKIAQGTPAEIRANDAVVQAYLGELGAITDA